LGAAAVLPLPPLPPLPPQPLHEVLMLLEWLMLVRGRAFWTSDWWSMCLSMCTT